MARTLVPRDASTIATSTFTTPSTTITDPAVIQSYNRGAISGVFPVPSSCLSTMTYVGGSIYFGHDFTNYYDPSCYPSLSVSATGWDIYYYSPAVSCPSGWSEASTFSNTFGGYASQSISNFFSLGSETTAVLCCPSGFFAATSGSGHKCSSLFPLGTQTISYITPIALPNGVWSVPSVQSTVTTLLSHSQSYGIFGDGIPIWYQSSDQVAFEATGATGTPSSSSTSSSPGPTDSAPSPQASTGLSSGAKAGIGVGVSLGALAIVAFAAFILRKRRKYHVAPTDELPASTSGPGELYQDAATNKDMPTRNEPVRYEMSST